MVCAAAVATGSWPVGASTVVTTEAIDLTKTPIRGLPPSFKVTLYPFEFHRADELETAFAAIGHAHVDALITFSDLLTYVYAARVAELAASARLPAMYAFREIPDAGGLMSYGPNIPDMWRQSADYVVRILRGTPPADMAIEQPSRFELVVNLKTAKALGITVPGSVLLQANDRIE
jgi:putative ABC transport system substrate-binding protein